MNNCNTCWYYITDYDERDKAHFYCHLSMKPIDKPIKNCKDYKPENTKEHVRRQLQKISKNMDIIISIIGGRTEHEDFKEIYELVDNTRNRIKEIQRWNEK